MKPNLAPPSRTPLLAAGLVLLALQGCASKPTPAPRPVPAPAPATVPAPAPVITERRGTAPPAVTVVPVPGAEKADMRVGDRLWYRGGEGNAKPATILREVAALQGGQVQYRQFDIDASGRPSGQPRSRRQMLGTLELDNPGKATGQIRYVDFPLGLGKSWNYRYQIKARNGALTTYDIAARVEAEEVIETPAGRFKALRILHGGQWNVPVVEGTALKVSTGSLRSTVWFAPEIGNWVRFDSEILNANGATEARIYQELIRFERR